MELEVLYKLDFRSFHWAWVFLTLGFGGLVYAGIYSIRLMRKYGFKHPLQSIGLFQNLDLSGVGKFVVFVFIIFGLTVFVSLLVVIPIKTIKETKVLSLIQNNDYKIVEGNIEDFSSTKTDYYCSESFRISDVEFFYSNRDNFIGYSIISTDGGVIKSDGQYLRISYYDKDGRNIIWKIEGMKNH